MPRRRPSLHRGRTRPGRLQLLDNLLVGPLRASWAERPAIDTKSTSTCLVLDLGFGDTPATTLELAASLQPTQECRVVGIELEASRVLAARKTVSALPNTPQPDVSFEKGDFDLERLGLSEVSLIRAMNVLRGYPAEKVMSAQLSMLRVLRSGGLLVDGTTDTEGHLLAAHLWRRSEQSDGEGSCTYGGLALATDLVRGFGPRMFRDVLPRDLRRQVKAGEPIATLLDDWQCAFETITKEVHADARCYTTNRQRFEASARLLASQRSDIDASPAWLERGALCWKPTRPSLRPQVLSPGPFTSAI